MESQSETKLKGNIEVIIKDKKTDKLDFIYFNNSVLKKGQAALASSLGNSYGDSYDFFISRMVFGDNGTDGGVPKFVSKERNGLFGITRSIKPVISTIDRNLSNQLVLTAVLDYEDDSNGFTLNEMALQMNNGDLYSMATFADFNKTSNLQITWNWRLSFI